MRGRLLRVVVAAFGVTLILWLSGRSGDDSVSLVERADEARVDPSEGSYAVFAESTELTSNVTLSGAAKPSLTPPFPSELTFALRVPSQASLELSSALVMMQQVSRARVVMSIVIEDSSTGPSAVFEETYGVEEANRWNDIRIDLSSHAGRDVSITLSARPAVARDDVLWSSRVQAVWGDPRIVEGAGSTERPLRALLERATSGAERSPASALGIVSNLFLAALLSVVPARWGPMTALAPSVAIVFTLAATLMVFSVQSSVPLALGLLGALSILRFRAPVPRGSELLHLLYCLGLALAFGTSQPELGLGAAATCWVVGRLAGRSARPSRFRSRAYRFTASGPLDERAAARLEELAMGRTTRLERGAEALSFDTPLAAASFGEIVGFMSKARAAAPRFRLTVEARGASEGL